MKLRKHGTFTEEDAEAFLDALLGDDRDDPPNAQEAKKSFASVKSSASKKTSAITRSRRAERKKG